MLSLGWRTGAVTAPRAHGAEVACVIEAAEDERRAGLIDDGHTVLVRDPSDIGAVLAGLLRRGLSAADFDTFCTPSEYPLVNAAPLRAEWTGSPPAEVLQRDKDLQKKRVREAGIPVAGARLITRPRELSVSRYLENLLGVRHGGIVATRMVHLHDELHAPAHDMAQRAVTALGHDDGVFHLEVFDQGNRLIFGEYAGRIAGGEIPSVVRLQYGVNLDDAWARAVLGLESALAPNVAEDCFGKVSLSTPVVLDSCPGEEELLAREGVREVVSSLAAWFRSQAVVRPGPDKAVAYRPSAPAQRNKSTARKDSPTSLHPPESCRARATHTWRQDRGGSPPWPVKCRSTRRASWSRRVTRTRRHARSSPTGRCLAAAGATFDDVIKLTYYITDIAHVPRILAVRDEFIDQSRPPASTVVQVVALYRPDLLLEVGAFTLIPPQ